VYFLTIFTIFREKPRKKSLWQSKYGSGHNN
jgi:hypothetical protein